MKNRMIPMFTPVLAAMLLLCGAAAAENGITTWSELQAALNAGGTIALTQDITAGPGDNMLVVPAGVSVRLYMDGYTLNRNRTTADADGHVILVRSGGSLTLYSSGSLRMDNCTIENNTGSDGGGLFNDTAGTAHLLDVTVSGNAAVEHGGGITNYGTLTLSDASVTGNHALSNGGV